MIGMGRLGGSEQGYGSDADVLFVYEPTAESSRRTVDERAAPTRRTPSRTSCAACSASPAPTRPLGVDADLRPEGRQGPLVRIARRVRGLLRALVAPVGDAGAAAGGPGRR